MKISETLRFGKQLILDEINATCTATYGRSLVDIIASFRDMHILDAQNDVYELSRDGKIRTSNGLLYKKEPRLQ